MSSESIRAFCFEASASFACKDAKKQKDLFARSGAKIKGFL
jgi:hypothetical protein